ncbi:hypothetical protein BDB01DRAFT_730682 [Pilobolus umbonatus]|nr:hypothetical protein BDB01DRAFT_730682 [Pilobolus umbonatus]
MNPFECNFQQRYTTSLSKLSIDTFDKGGIVNENKLLFDTPKESHLVDNNSLPPTPPMSLTQSPVNTTTSFLVTPLEKNTTIIDETPTHRYATRRNKDKKKAKESDDEEEMEYLMRGSSHSGRKRRIIFDGDDAEDRRKKFLERNRIAAYKCRQKKKSWVMELEKHAEIKNEQNTELRSLVARLKEESIYLRNLLLTHGNCECESVQTYLRKTSAQITCNPNLGTANSNSTAVPAIVPNVNSTYRQDPSLLKSSYSPLSTMPHPSSYPTNFSAFPYSGTSTGLTPFLNTVMDKSGEANGYFIPQHLN